MKRTLLFVLALAAIPVAVDAQGTASASCEGLSAESPVEDVRPCAEQGDAPAQYFLGRMYDNGEGVPQDDVEAVSWYRLAADQGLAEAQHNLGVMYDNGEGVPQDDVAAVRWFRLAADQGDATAQAGLGSRYGL